MTFADDRDSISVGSGVNLTVTDSLFRNNGQDGVDINGNDSTVTVRNSSFINNSDDGIDFNGNGNKLNISGLSILNNGNNGIEIDASDSTLTVSDSSFTGNTGDGICPFNDLFESAFSLFTIAAKEKPFPTAADFAKAVQQVAPTVKRATKSENPKTQLCNSVTASQQSHPRYGESGVIEADAPNHWQQIVTFSDSERVLINNTDLDAPSVPFPRERTYPAEYTEAMSTTGYAYAAIEERHKQELERLSQELRIGLQTETTARAEEQVQEQVESLQKLFKQQKEQNIQLQQRLDEMESLRQLETENQQLRQRIQDLERAVEERPSLRDATRTQQWGNTMSKRVKH